MVFETVTAGWQRARQPEQKRQRKREILAAAAELFDREGFDGVTLNGVAREAKLAKSNLYRYFESLEEMLLHLFLEDFDELLGRMEFAEEVAGRALEEIAEWLAVELESRPRLAVLLTQLNVVLERNLSIEVGEHFKREVADRSARLAGWLYRALPGLGRGDATAVTLTLHALVAGFWPMAHPSPVMQQVLEEPELQHLRVRFVPAFSQALAGYLRGVMQGGYQTENGTNESWGQ